MEEYDITGQGPLVGGSHCWMRAGPSSSQRTQTEISSADALGIEVLKQPPSPKSQNKERLPSPGVCLLSSGQ